MVLCVSVILFGEAQREEVGFGSDLALSHFCPVQVWESQRLDLV